MNVCLTDQLTSTPIFKFSKSVSAFSISAIVTPTPTPTPTPTIIAVIPSPLLSIHHHHHHHHHNPHHHHHQTRYLHKTTNDNLQSPISNLQHRQLPKPLKPSNLLFRPPKTQEFANSPTLLTHNLHHPSQIPNPSLSSPFHPPSPIPSHPTPSHLINSFNPPSSLSKPLLLHYISNKYLSPYPFSYYSPSLNPT